MDRKIQPQTQTIDYFSIVAPKRTKLSNGIPITIIDAGEQEVVRLDIMFAGGRWRQKRKLQSVFTNRMLKEGTFRLSSGEIAEKLDYYGAWLELSSSVDYEYITLYSLNKHFDKTIKIVESIIKEPTFPEKELSVVINSNIQQYKINSSKVDFIAHRTLLKNLYGDLHPCGDLVVESDYSALTKADLFDFYQTYYNTENCSIFISGKITDQILELINDSFGTSSFGIGKKAEPLENYPITISPEKRIFVEHKNALQSSVKLGCHTLTRNHPDYLKYRVMVKLFGGYFGSRLMTNIREDKGYTYGISAGSLYYPNDGMLMISAETDNKHVENLITEIYNEIRLLQSENVSEEELLLVKNYMIGDMCRSYESPFALSEAWIFIYAFKLEDDYFNKSMQAIQHITPDEIKEMANKYLSVDKMKEVIVGN